MKKRKPNWKLMSEKDKAKFRLKYGTVSPKRGRSRKQKSCFMSVKESKALVKAARIPRDQWVRVEGKEKNRIVL